MTRHFSVNVAQRKERKGEKLQKGLNRQLSRAQPKKTICWFLPDPIRPKKKVRTSFFVTRNSGMDLDEVHERINKVIPNTTVKGEPGLPFFMVLLSQPLSFDIFDSKIRKALEGLI